MELQKLKTLTKQPKKVAVFLPLINYIRQKKANQDKDQFLNVS
jgi:hypothetical protein